MKTITMLTLVRDIVAEANKWRAMGKRPSLKGDAPPEMVRSGPQHLRPDDTKQAAPATADVKAKTGKPPTESPLKPKNLFELLKDTFGEWNADKAPQLAAALAYYTVFSLAPLLIIVIAIAGLVFGHDAAQNKIESQVQGVVGQQGAVVIQDMLKNANKPAAGVVATVIGVVTLLAGAAGVFGQLKAALNTIWNVPPAQGPGGLKGILVTLQQQFLSFTMVLGIGFLLLVSLVLSAMIAALNTFVGDRLPVPPIAWEIINFVISFGVITLLFAAIYKVLPDARIAWSDVWIGAAITSLLFTIGKVLLGLYLGQGSVASSYGAAGSLVIVLLWVYYSAQILFFGAEFTQVYANRYGSHIAYRSALPPKPTAQPVHA